MATYNHEMYLQAHNDLIDLKRDRRAVARGLKRYLGESHVQELTELQRVIEQKINSKENVLKLMEKSREE